MKKEKIERRWGRERERKRERETDRQTDRQTDRHRRPFSNLDGCRAICCEI